MKNSYLSQSKSRTSESSREKDLLQWDSFQETIIKSNAE